MQTNLFLLNKAAAFSALAECKDIDELKQPFQLHAAETVIYLKKNRDQLPLSIRAIYSGRGKSDSHQLPGIWLATLAEIALLPDSCAVGPWPSKENPRTMIGIAKTLPTIIMIYDERNTPLEVWQVRCRSSSHVCKELSQVIPPVSNSSSPSQGGRYLILSPNSPTINLDGEIYTLEGTVYDFLRCIVGQGGQNVPMGEPYRKARRDLYRKLPKNVQEILTSSKAGWTIDRSVAISLEN